MRRTSCAFAALCLIGLSGCSEQAPPPAPDRPVRTTTVRARVVAEPIVLTGHVLAREEIKIAFRIDGKLTERLVTAGDQVRPNQMLARLDPLNEQNALRGSEAELASAQASVTQAKNNESRLRRNNAPSEQLDQAVQQQKSAEAQLEAAEAKLRMAQDRLRYTELRAEVAGVVTQKGAEPGEVVRAGQPVVVLARNNAKDALFHVPPQVMLIRGLTRDAPVEVALSENQNIAAKGRISEIAPQADPATRTIPVRVALTDPPLEMLFGATVTGRVMRPPAAVIEVPGSALAELDGLPAVWIVDPKEKTVTLRPVRVARYEAASVIIAQGLGEGEIIVTAGVQALRPSQKIRLLDPT
jgi:membrane fusion protein, multidrug efflux system